MDVVQAPPSVGRRRDPGHASILRRSIRCRSSTLPSVKYSAAPTTSSGSPTRPKARPGAVVGRHDVRCPRGGDVGREPAGHDRVDPHRRAEGRGHRLGQVVERSLRRGVGHHVGRGPDGREGRDVDDRSAAGGRAISEPSPRQAERALHVHRHHLVPAASSVMSLTRLYSGDMPALLTRTSTPPTPRALDLPSRSQSDQLLTLHATWQGPHADRSAPFSAASVLQAGSLRLAITTSAPALGEAHDDGAAQAAAAARHHGPCRSGRTGVGGHGRLGGGAESSRPVGDHRLIVAAGVPGRDRGSGPRGGAAGCAP